MNVGVLDSNDGPKMERVSIVVGKTDTVSNNRSIRILFSVRASGRGFAGETLLVNLTSLREATVARIEGKISLTSAVAVMPPSD